MADTGGPDTVDIPQIGRVKKEYVWAGGAIVVGIVAYAWWRHRASAATGGPVVDTTGGSTGATGGSPPPIIPAATSTSTLPTTNQQWTQDVLDHMGVIGGSEQAHVLSVIGKYLNKIALTAEEADLIRQAWALSGKPPQGPDNFILATGGSTTGTPPPATHLPAPTGLHGTPGKFAVNRDGTMDPTTTYIDVSWDPVPGATGYHFLEFSTFGSQQFDLTADQHGIHENVAKPDTDHHISVRAKGSDGTPGDPASITVHTPIFHK